MDSEEHTGKRCFSLDHRTTNQQGNLWSLPIRNLDLTSFSLKYSSKCALKSPKRRGLARLASARRPNSIRSAMLFSQIYPWNNDLLITTSQGVINVSQIYALNNVISTFRNRIYSGDKVIPEIRHIYPWNKVIPPQFRNLLLVIKFFSEIPVAVVVFLSSLLIAIWLSLTKSATLRKKRYLLAFVTSQ